MGNPDHLDPKSQKVHQLWTRVKHAKSQVNGQSELTLHNRILKSEAKARQF
ncbi:YpzG family protein [Rummeliibacillus sp. JY-2-4R]